MLGISENHYPYFVFLLEHHVALIAFLCFCIMILANRGMPLGVIDA